MKDADTIHLKQVIGSASLRLALLQGKVNAVLLGSLGERLNVRVGDFDIGNARAVPHELL